ncbi:MAG TPA: hypothetical protein VI277_04605, partial [Candidatus Limnocylindria bacterium]
MVDSIRRFDVYTILTIILVGGLALRVFIAGIYLPLSGLSNDIGSFAAWGQRMASVGPGGFYEAGYFADYPPGYLYVLWVLGEMGAALAPLVGRDATGGLVKIPGVLADVGVAWMLFVIARRWGGELIDRARLNVTPETLGLAAATLYLFNPGTIFESAIWGQVDSVGTLVLLATIYALGRGWTEVAALGAVFALLVKFQFAFLIPVVIIVGLKRHLFGRSSDPRHAGRRDGLRVLTSLAVGVVGLTVLILPFGMFIYAPLAGGDPRGLLGILPEADPTSSLIGKLIEAAGTYQGLTINAFNLWRNPWSGLGDSLGHYGNDAAVAIVLGGMNLTWQHVGTLMFGAVAAVALVCVARRDDMRGVLLVALVLAIAFFALPTRVHERYLFPALAIGALLVLSGRAWPWIYASLSVCFFANLYWAYSDDWSFTLPTITNPGLGGAPMPQDPLLAATLFTDTGIWLLGLLITVTLAVVVWHTLRYAFGTSHAPIPAPVPIAASRLPARPRAEPASGMATSGWLAVNPADAYLREPTRRLGRRDLMIVFVLIAGALVFRLWRLEVPRGHHFDEVYHARSAAEFISAWRNGWDRDVYEWTHPMLAKYLIAAGIVAVDPNTVSGSQEIDGPSGALAIAPRREFVGHDRSITFRVEDGTTIVASDTADGDEVGRWEAGGPIAALAYDPLGVRLLVGRTDSGTVETYELAGLLASPDGRAPPEGPPIESGLASVVELLIPTQENDPIVLRGTEGVAVVIREDATVTTTETGSYRGIAYVRGVDDEEEEATDVVLVTDPLAGTIVALDAATLDVVGEPIEVSAPLVGPLIAIGGGDDVQVVALTGALEATEEHPATVGGMAVLDGDGSNGRCSGDPCVMGLVPLPGAPELIGHQRIANLVYVAGTTADGNPEVWTVEPHFESRGSGSIGMAAYDATPLPASALAMAFDIASTAQGDDAGRLVVSTADAQLVTIDVGTNAFAWRMAGVIFGSLLVGLIYLL